MTRLIDVSLEEESATGQRLRKNKKNRTGTTGITEVVLENSKNQRIPEVRGDFWTWSDPN